MDDVAGRVGQVGLADVGQRLGIGQYVEGLFQFGKFVRADQHRDGATVSGGGHALAVVLHAVHELAEMVTDIPQRLCTHDTNSAPAPRRLRSPHADSRLAQKVGAKAYPAKELAESIGNPSPIPVGAVLDTCSLNPLDLTTVGIQ